MSTEAGDEWIGVADVAAELKLSERLTWELIKRLRVPLLPGLATMARARFKRSDWEEALERSKAPAPARSQAGAAVGAPASRPKAKAPSVSEELSAWRKAKGVKA